MPKAILLGLVFSSILASAEPLCQHVGGGIVTNFLDAQTTFGSATGDLGGGIGVSILSLTPGAGGTLLFHNQHHWVLSTGDTLFVPPADAIAYPTPVTGLYAATYPDGVLISGGTGRFKNATGKIAAWGAVDTNRSELSLRYEGKVCFASLDDQ